MITRRRARQRNDRGRIDRRRIRARPARLADEQVSQRTPQRLRPAQRPPRPLRRQPSAPNLVSPRSRPMREIEDLNPFRDGDRKLEDPRDYVTEETGQVIGMLFNHGQIKNAKGAISTAADSNRANIRKMLFWKVRNEFELKMMQRNMTIKNWKKENIGNRKNKR